MYNLVARRHQVLVGAYVPWTRWTTGEGSLMPPDKVQRTESAKGHSFAQICEQDRVSFAAL